MVNREFVFTHFTNDLRRARVADSAGVDRIGIDIERIGKHRRQDTGPHWISDHVVEDLEAVASVLDRAALFARTNPIHSDSKNEIEQLLAGRAQVLMLPSFDTLAEAESFVEMIAGRALVVLLIETPSSIEIAGRLAALDGVDEVHIGLNDLHLALEMKNPFEMFRSDMVRRATSELREQGLPFGIAGVARVGDSSLPVASDEVHRCIVDSGASRTLISRSFFRNADIDVSGEIHRLRGSLRRLAAAVAP